MEKGTIGRASQGFCSHCSLLNCPLVQFNGLNCFMLNEALVHMVENCKPNIEYLIERHSADLDYIMPTINALIERENRTMT
jgi:hypothetical protein